MFPFSNVLHDISRWTLLLDFLLHVIHIRCNVAEKVSITLTQVIEQMRFFGQLHEPILRTFAVASEQPFAFTAIPGQLFLFQFEEPIRLFTVQQLNQRLLVNIP